MPTVKSWAEAESAVGTFANGRRIFWGVGNTEPSGSVVAVSLNYNAGQGRGYYCTVRDSNPRESFVVKVED